MSKNISSFIPDFVNLYQYLASFFLVSLAEVLLIFSKIKIWDSLVFLCCLPIFHSIDSALIFIILFLLLALHLTWSSFSTFLRQKLNVIDLRSIISISTWILESACQVLQKTLLGFWLGFWLGCVESTRQNGENWHLNI